MRKVKNDPNAAPPGGWLGPDSFDTQDPVGNPRSSARIATAHATGTKIIKGKLEWVWKPVTPDYLASKIRVVPSAPKIRVRTRKVREGD